MAHWRNKRLKRPAIQLDSDDARRKYAPMQVLRTAVDPAEAMAELDYFCGRLVVDVFDLCEVGCEWCDPMHDDDALDRAFGLYTGTNVEVGSLAPATLATIGDAVGR